MTFDTVNASALAVFPRLLQVWLPQGQVRGHEYVVGNVQGEPGDSLSINVQTGVWSDFASDEGGSDPVSLYAAVFGLEQGEACRRLGGELGLSAPGTAPVPAPAKEDNWQPVLPAPAPPPSSFVHRNLGNPSATWTYRSADGDPLFLVCRFETPKGKVILPYTYGTLNGAKGWHWKHPKPPRPLYGLERLAQKPDAPVLIVEGEKTVDAAGRAPFADHVAVTWPGGSNAVNKADWTPLKGRRVVIWPDADDAGKKAARAVAQAVLAAGADQVRKVEPPPEHTWRGRRRGRRRWHRRRRRRRCPRHRIP